MPPGYLVAGHVCIDVSCPETGGGPTGCVSRLGGTALYAAQQARRLGYEVDVCAACSDATAAEALDAWDHGVRLHPRDDSADTVFQFESGETEGPTRLVARARAIERLPTTPLHKVIHLAPVAGELTAHVVEEALRADAFTGVTAQGFLRAFAADGAVQLAPVVPHEIFQADALVVSEDEYDVLIAASTRVPTAALQFVTRGAGGAAVYEGDVTIAEAAPQVRHPVTRTVGAGDVFATVVFCALAEGAGAVQALRFAVRAAEIYVGRGADLAAVARRSELDMP